MRRELVVLLACLSVASATYGYVTWTHDSPELYVTEHASAVPIVHIARATYTNQINETGWAFLEVHTAPGATDERQAYSAGYLEGFLTRDLIWMHWQNMLKNYCVNKTEICALIDGFVDKNEEYIGQVVRDHADTDPYWYQMKLYYIQIEGLAMGYNEATANEFEKLSLRDIVWINMLGDLDEIAFSLSLPARASPDGALFADQRDEPGDQLRDEPGDQLRDEPGDLRKGPVDVLRNEPMVAQDESANEQHDGLQNGPRDELRHKPRKGARAEEWDELQDQLLFPDHCSGLVKLLPDHSELYVSHVTWNSYQSMLRIQKMYVLNYRTSPADPALIPGHKMSFTSYPAFVQSTDDFYIISSGLVAAETTIGNSNASLYRLVSPVGQVLEYARAMVAGRLARAAQHWVDLFRRHNSGTYNNQWYIVDYNKFSPPSQDGASRIAPGLLWVIEQLPGTTESADLTERLVRESYFPSYNIASFPRIFNASGGQARLRRYGDWFGYHTNPRARMFNEKQKSIRNLRDMFSTMRYNDYKHDPLARCAECTPPYSACNAIAARNDLNPSNGTYPFRALGHRSHGGTDAKVTSSRLRTAYQFVAVSSPAYNISRGVPPFQWSAFDLGSRVSHVGHPDMWLFKPLVHRWEWG